MSKEFTVYFSIGRLEVKQEAEDRDEAVDKAIETVREWKLQDVGFNVIDVMEEK